VQEHEVVTFAEDENFGNEEVVSAENVDDVHGGDNKKPSTSSGFRVVLDDVRSKQSTSPFKKHRGDKSLDDFDSDEEKDTNMSDAFDSDVDERRLVIVEDPSSSNEEGSSDDERRSESVVSSSSNNDDADDPNYVMSSSDGEEWNTDEHEGSPSPPPEPKSKILYSTSNKFLFRDDFNFYDACCKCT